MNKVRACGGFPKWAKSGFVGSTSIKQPLFGQKFLSLKTKMESINCPSHGVGVGGRLRLPGSQLNSLVES